MINNKRIIGIATVMSMIVIIGLIVWYAQGISATSAPLAALEASLGFQVKPFDGLQWGLSYKQIKARKFTLGPSIWTKEGGFLCSVVDSPMANPAFVRNAPTTPVVILNSWGRLIAVGYHIEFAHKVRGRWHAVAGGAEAFGGNMRTYLEHRHPDMTFLEVGSGFKMINLNHPGCYVDVALFEDEDTQWVGIYYNPDETKLAQLLHH